MPPGPPPNPNARRRNKAATFTVLPAADRLVPPLPGHHGQAVRTAWAAWWASPMAARWDDGDLPSLYVMAAAYAGALEGSSKAAAEFRQLCDRFGLTPVSRLRLRWTLEEEAGRPVKDATVVRLRVVEEPDGA